MFDRLREWNRERKEKWESYCKQCGICCYEKKLSIKGGYYIDYNSPCKHLYPATKQCTVYENRFSVCKDCKKLTIFHALFTGHLPDTCGYVEAFRKPLQFSTLLRSHHRQNNNR